MIDAIPVFINSPFDDNETVDPDEEFREDITHPDSEVDSEEDDTTEGVSIEEEPLTGDDIKDVTGVDEIVPDPEDDGVPDSLDEALEDHKEITGTDASDIKKLSEDVQDSILDDIQEATSEATDTWSDLEGEINEKLPDVSELEISKLKEAMESILGVVCGNGVGNSDLDLPFFDNVVKDLINKGLKKLLDCLKKEGIITDMEKHFENIVIDSIDDVIETGKADMIDWASDSITGGIGNVFGEELVDPISSSLTLALDHKNSDDKGALDQVTDIYDELTPDWLSSPFAVRTQDNDEPPKYSLSAFASPSAGSRRLYMSDETLMVSVIAGDAIRENGDKCIHDSYPLSAGKGLR